MSFSGDAGSCCTTVTDLHVGNLNIFTSVFHRHGAKLNPRTDCMDSSVQQVLSLRAWLSGL